MHGTIYLYLKTEDDLQRRCVPWMWRTFFLFVALYVGVTIYTLVEVPRATANFEDYPIFWVVAVLNLLAVANIPRAIHKGRPGYAFVSSCCVIAAFGFLFCAGIYPNLVPATDAAMSLTIYGTARSSPKTLRIMLIIAAIGMPFVLAYTTVIYWTFRGKVQLGEGAY
jgi:cytochrome d ubiquinol oxidase subunit II